MADRYAEMRAALDEAPTPGPWRVQATGHSFIIESHTHTESFSVDSEGRRCRWSEYTEATAKLIAACSPDIIRALLAERDALREALAECLRVNETDAGADVAVWANAMLVARAALAQGQEET